MANLPPLSTTIGTWADMPEDFPLMFYVADCEGTILKVGDTWLKILGYMRDDVLGEKETRFLTDDSAAEAALGMTRFLETGRVDRRHCEFVRKDGRIQPCVFSAYILGDDAGRHSRTIAVMTPMVEAAASVAHMQQKSFRLQSCLEGTNAGTWEWNVQTGETRFSERWAEIAGYSVQELSPVSVNTWLDLSHPDDLEEAHARLEAHWAGDIKFYDIETRMRHKDGHWVWIHARGRVFTWTKAGEPEWMFGTHVSIDDRKRLENEAIRVQRLMRRSGNAAGIGGWELDLQTNELSWTEETRRIHGVDEDYVPDVERAIEFYAPEARPVVLQAVEAGLSDGTPWDLELPFIRQTGERIWVRTVGGVNFTEGKPTLLFGAFQDITERVREREELSKARAAAQQAQDRLWSAIEALPEAFVIYDADDKAVMFNNKYRDLYKASAKAIKIGAKFEDILREGLKNGQYLEAVGREEAWLAERLDRHRNPQGPIEQQLPDDRYLQIHEAKLPNGDTVGFRVDVTEIKLQKKELLKRAAELEIAATTDPLTGLQNRRGLERCMEKLAAEANGDARFALLHVDLDRFKPINDVFGHAAGDHLLREVSAILTANAREEDHVARVGGDEFVVLLNAPCNEDDAEQVAQRIMSASTAPVKWQDKTLHFGASVGIALGAGDRLRNMLHDADIALYEAKKAGRGRHHVFSASLRHAVETRQALSDELIRGLERGEIVAYCQPQVSAFDGTLVGFEALARWQHPDRGLLLPRDFLPIAADLGVTSEIDRLVSDHAVEIGHSLISAGAGLEQVSVNAGLKQLTQSSFLEWLPDPALLPFRYCLEILEAVDVDREFDEISWAFDGLRERGVQIEVDDFGSGRASLTALLKIRPDRIKLDIEIVRAALSDPVGAGSMVRAIAEMCRGLGIPMTAEGVETWRHAELMRDMGCDILQGYHFARPMDHEALMAWVMAREPRDGRTGRKASGALP